MEFQENEIISCILTVGVSLFVLLNHRAVAQIPCHRWLLRGLLCFLLSNFFTVLEGAMLTKLFNGLEHLTYTGCLVSLAIWARGVYGRGERTDV